MTTDTDIQVLVIGDELSGLTLAAFLHRAGLDPVVIKRGERTAGFRGAVELWPDAMTMLAELGVADRVGDAGVPVTTWMRRQPDGTISRRLEAANGPGYVAIEYTRLREQVRDALPDGAVYTASAIQALDSGRSGVTVEFANGVREQFDIVVGADGARSRTRELFGGPDASFCGTTSVAFPLDAGPLDGASEIWTADGAVFRAIPTGDRAAGMLTVPTTVPGQHWDDPSTFLDRCSEIDWLLPEAVDGLPVDALWWQDDFRVRADTMADDRVALVGTAAHAYHRLTGVNATLGIEDAAVLAVELVGRDDALAARLASYASRRQARLDSLEPATAGDPPLSGITSDLADRYPSIPAVRGARLAACFTGTPPTPAVETVPSER